MTDFSTKLSAYLDGELDPTAAEEVEARLASDPDAQAELDLLMGIDAMAQEDFADQLNEPVPFALAQQIKNTPLQEPNAPSRPIWGTLAASLVVFAMGGAGGYVLKDQTTPPVVTAGWLADIADYHAVYASQGRHLVEVGADEAEHIETWLGNTIGASFSIPDLSGFDLTFEGGRLLVANGKPVAQLMYRDADGAVVALCLQQSDTETTAPPTFNERTINGFDFVSWRGGNAQYVVIGESGTPELQDIAAAAALEI
ncbi:anti-sigma factor [Yoonia sp. F2084L]|uniref:anti-sigma factor family protein n=1 Tax=Yoonia sp. F2084L TaxID=2926419 RepID=UPI001FF3D78A|nr:anti-sigma factor [Yoonia sp. F2084L]MCK0096580.1 anti-sigma factor [Yoonia sp. F2084L]